MGKPASIDSKNGRRCRQRAVSVGSAHCTGWYSLTASGEGFLTCVQSDGATGGAVVFEARRGVLTGPAGRGA